MTAVPPTALWSLPLFRHCPRCGARSVDGDDGRRFLCADCGFRYYHNVAAAVAAVIVHDGCLLVTRRAHEPAAGLLDLPGGFVDPGEVAEHALQRELTEELGWTPSDCTPRYLGTRPNSYIYAGVRYATCDGFYRYDPPARPRLLGNPEIAAWSWERLATLAPAAFGFDSVRGIVTELVVSSLSTLVSATDPVP